MLKTPVAFLVFNRPDTTRRVFDAIAAARPQTLLVVADGPRAHRAGEAERCREVRAIVDRVDWPCEVVKHYADANLGCRHRVSSGIDWVFSQVEEAIILEDDCLPCADFFPYCVEMLTRYRNDQRVMHISGTNLTANRFSTDDSYFLSRYPLIWGWATWRRAWRHYDVKMRNWPAVKVSPTFSGMFTNEVERRFYFEHFDRFYSDTPDTWDWQWTYTCWCHGGLSITPSINLISNIGFGVEATHTHDYDSRVAELATGTLRSWRHPQVFQRHVAADDYYFRELAGGRGFERMQRPYFRLRRWFGAWRRNASRELRGCLTRATGTPGVRDH